MSKIFPVCVLHVQIDSIFFCFQELYLYDSAGKELFSDFVSKFVSTDYREIVMLTELSQAHYI